MKQMTDKNKVIFPNIHTRGGSRWISRISSQRIWSDMGTGCHGVQESPSLEVVQRLRTRVGGGTWLARLMVRLDDLEGSFPPWTTL